MANKFTPATDITRASVSNGQTVLLMASVILFALFCLGYAGAALTAQGVENWKSARIAHVQP